MKIQLHLIFSENKKIILTLGFLLLNACGPSAFQAGTQDSSSTLNDTKSNDSKTPTSETNVIQSSVKTCLLASNNPVKIGDNVKFEFSANFEIPKDSSFIWKGQSYNVSFTEKTDGHSWLSRGLSYSSPIQAGIHKRQVILNDASGNLICQSNVLKVEFTGDVPANIACANANGQLTGEDKENCTIEAWTLYRAMSARNLVNIPPQSGSALGLANPSSVNCVNIGGNNVSSSDGSGSNCVVSKYKIWNLGF